MPRLFLDFETYYAKGYTLSSPKVAMSEYIRDIQFKAHMVQWAVDDGEMQWCDTDLIQTVLDRLDWSEIELVCHNTAFDGFILSQHYGKVPARYADTMLMSRALYGATAKHSLDELAKRLRLPGKIKGVLEEMKGKRDLTEDELVRLAEYGIQDIDTMRQAFDIMVSLMPPDELDLIDITLRMFCDPVLDLDLPRINAELEREVGQKVAKVLRAGVLAEQLSSNEKFAELLRSMGVPPPLKISPTTNEPTYAFAKKDTDFLDLKKHPTPAVRDLIEARLAVKSSIGETRALRFLRAGEDGKKLPVLLNYCGAHTTRWSAGNKMNMQNLPAKGELRKSILAPPGYVLVVLDSSQIEARQNLWLADDTEKLKIFREYDAGLGPDLYRVMAARIFGKPVDQITGDERFLGKVCVLALGFGMGADKLQDTLATDKYNPMHLPIDECRRVVTIYRESNEPIVKLWERMEQLASFMILDIPIEYKALAFRRHQMVLPSGLGIHYEGLSGQWSEWASKHYNMFYRNRKGPTKLYGGLLTENAVQALARCVVAEQMRKIAKRYRIVMMTHDECVYLVPEAEADEGLAWGMNIFKTPPDWAPDLPVNAEGAYDHFYCK